MRKFRHSIIVVRMQVFDIFLIGNDTGFISLLILAPLMLFLVIIRSLAIQKYKMEGKTNTQQSMLGKFGDQLANGTLPVFDLIYILIAVLGIGGLVLFFFSYWWSYGFSPNYFLVFYSPPILAALVLMGYITYTRFTLVGKAWAQARSNLREFGKLNFDKTSIGDVISRLVKDINEGSIEDSRFAIRQLEHLLNNQHRTGAISQEILRAVDNDLWEEYRKAQSRSFLKSFTILFAIVSVIFIITSFITGGFSFFFAVFLFFHASIFYYLEG